MDHDQHLTQPLDTADLNLNENPPYYMAAVQDAAYGLRSGETAQYVILPAQSADKVLPDDTPYWRIDLQLANATITMGFDIVGDIVIGRGTGADLDLSVIDAHEMGVSRRHALLRPTSHYLYLVDLESRNGIRVNGMRMGQNEARAIQDRFMLTLGTLAMTIRVVDHSTVGHLKQRLLARQSEQEGGPSIPAPSTDQEPDTEHQLNPLVDASTEQVMTWLTSQRAYMNKMLDKSDDTPSA